MPASSAASRASATRSARADAQHVQAAKRSQGPRSQRCHRPAFGECQRPREHFLGPLHVRRGCALAGEQPGLAGGRVIAARGGPHCHRPRDSLGLRIPEAAQRDARRHQLQPLAHRRASAVARRVQPPLGLVPVHADQGRLREGEVNPRLLSLTASAKDSRSPSSRARSKRPAATSDSSSSSCTTG